MAAECDDGEHTRFHFLATVRALVATVVTMLVVAVVVMVIAVLHRPVEMEFRSYGYVQAEFDWWQIRANTTPPDAVAPSYEYEPATKVDILLTLTAVNPSGRGEIKGSIDIIHVVDIVNMVEFCVLEPNASVSFDLRRHTSHRYRRWVHMVQAEQLQYLYDNHRQDESGFSVLLVVETTYKPQAHPVKKKVYYCSPVTFIRIGVETPERRGHVSCQTAQDMGYTPKYNSRL